MVDSVTKAKPPERFQTGKPSRGEKAARIVKWDEESRRGRSDHPGMGAAPCPRVPLGQLQEHQPVCCCCPAVPCGQCPFTSACQRRNLSLRGFRRLRPAGSRDRACASSCSLPLRGIVGNQAPAQCMLGSAEETSQADTTTARDATPLSSDCSLMSFTWHCTEPSVSHTCHSWEENTHACGSAVRLFPGARCSYGDGRHSRDAGS